MCVKVCAFMHACVNDCVRASGREGGGGQRRKGAFDVKIVVKY